MPPSEGEFIAALVADLVTELGDALHTVAHQEAVAALRRRSGLAEAAFAEVLCGQDPQARAGAEQLLGRVSAGVRRMLAVRPASPAPPAQMHDDVSRSLSGAETHRRKV
jgi:hypothetical protein